MAATVAAVFGLNVTGAGLADAVVPWVGHGMSHAAVALPVAALAVFALRAWPEPKAVVPGRAARRVVIAGFLGVATGQFLEILGARVDEPNSHHLEAAAHTAGQVVTMLSMLVLVAGAGLAAVAAARTASARSRLLVVGLAVAAAAAVAVLFLGLPET